MILGVEHSKLVNFVARIVGSQDAEDVAQTAYYKALRSASLFRGDCQGSTWVFHIARRAALDHLRTKKRHPENMIEADIPCVVLTAEHQLRIREALRSITPIYARALWAFVTLGSVEDAARSLGIPEGTLKSRVHRARLELEKIQ